MERYIRDLAANLRGNGVAEERVIDILTEIASDPRVDPSRPERTLGSPKELADSYGRSHSRSTGFKVISISMAIAVVIAGAKVISSLALGIHTSPTTTILTYAAAVIVAVIGVGIAARLDRRIPAGLQDRSIEGNAHW